MLSSLPPASFLPLPWQLTLLCRFEQALLPGSTNLAFSMQGFLGVSGEQLLNSCFTADIMLPKDNAKICMKNCMLMIGQQVSVYELWEAHCHIIGLESWSLQRRSLNSQSIPEAELLACWAMLPNRNWISCSGSMFMHTCNSDSL